MLTPMVLSHAGVIRWTKPKLERSSASLPFWRRRWSDLGVSTTQERVGDDNGLLTSVSTGEAHWRWSGDALMSRKAALPFVDVVDRDLPAAVR